MNDPVFRNVRFLPGTIHAGFPSLASDYEEGELDINDLVVPHPTTSYFMRVDGDSMTGACIYSGDIIVIDRAVTAANNRIVVARIGEDFTLKRLQIIQNRKIFLKPENPKYIWLSLRIGKLVCFWHHCPAIIGICQRALITKHMAVIQTTSWRSQNLIMYTEGDMMDADSMIDALQARGPHPDLAEHLMLFGQFVGAWDVDVTNIAPDGTKQELKGEWHFGWALEGRAIMDVWITPRRSLRGQADPYEYGATLRFFDPTIHAWRSTWIGPVRHLVRTFIARQVEDEIILEGSFEQGSRIRWIFSQITATSFSWRNMESSDDGATWTKVQEMAAQRALP